MDNYLVSARKYRPSTFHSVVGQTALTTTLKNAILNKKLAHAYLFCGPRGVGKTTCARIFAKAINCMHLTPEGEACNECESCVAFNEQRSFNIHELDAASNNSVEGIRSLIEEVRVPPQMGKYKVYIIDEVHMLSVPAFNAFLKTLEEPPSYAIFILATTEKHKILPTILSRCQIYDFNRIGVKDIADYLEYVARSENILVEKDALHVIARKADGGMRDALSLFDQVSSYSGGSVTYRSVLQNLNVLDYECYFKLTDCILSGNVSGCILLLDEILSQGFDGLQIVNGYASFFRDLLVCKDTGTLKLLEVGEVAESKYRHYAEKCSIEFLYKALDLTNSCDLNFRMSRNKRLLVELLLIHLCQCSSGSGPVPLYAEKKNKVAPLQEGVNTKAEENPEESHVSAREEGKEVEEVTAHLSEEGEIRHRTVNTRSFAKNPPSISIKRHDVKEKIPENSSASEMVGGNAVTDFSREELNAAWREYAQTQLGKEEIHLKNTMLNVLPDLLPGYEISIPVYNPEQEVKLNEYALSIVNFLRNKLKNGEIRMKVTISENNDKKMVYTDSEKYKLMLSQNPKLGELSKKFNLRIY